MQTLKNTFEKTAVGGRNKRIWSGFLKVLENNPLQLDGETQKESAERITLKLIEIVDDVYDAPGRRDRTDEDPLIITDEDIPF